MITVDLLTKSDYRIVISQLDEYIRHLTMDTELEDVNIKDLDHWYKYWDQIHDDNKNVFDEINLVDNINLMMDDEYLSEQTKEEITDNIKYLNDNLEFAKQHSPELLSKIDICINNNKRYL